MDLFFAHRGVWSSVIDIRAYVAETFGPVSITVLIRREVRCTVCMRETLSIWILLQLFGFPRLQETWTCREQEESEHGITFPFSSWNINQAELRLCREELSSICILSRTVIIAISLTWYRHLFDSTCSPSLATSSHLHYFHGGNGKLRSTVQHFRYRRVIQEPYHREQWKDGHPLSLK